MTLEPTGHATGEHDALLALTQALRVRCFACEAEVELEEAWLQTTGLPGGVTIFGIVLLVGSVNLVVGSADIDDSLGNASDTGSASHVSEEKIDTDPSDVMR